MVTHRATEYDASALKRRVRINRVWTRITTCVEMHRSRSLTPQRM